MTVPLATAGFWLTGLERGLLLGALAVALGGLAGRGLARNYKGTGPAPLPAPWALRASLVGLAASAALVVTALAGPNLAAQLARPPVAALRSSATLDIAIAECACFAIAAVLLRLRRPGPSVLPLLGVALAEALRGHAEGIIPVAGALVTLCHVVPAVLWAGMLAYTLRAAVAWRGDPAAMQGLIRLYANAAAWLLAIVVVTGVVSALLLVPLGSLFSTGYGWLLVVKAALVATAAALAVAGRLALRRPVPAGTGPARASRAEVVALAAVLVIAGLLTVLTPPAKPVYPTGLRAPAHAARHNDHSWRSPSTSPP
ncbi:MAG TPA: CopD family protein [Streptosporangiaceae bacterium]|nr:CopD family protein [Streptosporangiaceae bacterium]